MLPNSAILPLSRFIGIVALFHVIIFSLWFMLLTFIATYLFSFSFKSMNFLDLSMNIPLENANWSAFPRWPSHQIRLLMSNISASPFLSRQITTANAFPQVMFNPLFFIPFTFSHRWKFASKMKAFWRLPTNRTLSSAIFTAEWYFIGDGKSGPMLHASLWKMSVWLWWAPPPVTQIESSNRTIPTPSLWAKFIEDVFWEQCWALYLSNDCIAKSHN